MWKKATLAEAVVHKFICGIENNEYRKDMSTAQTYTLNGIVGVKMANRFGKNCINSSLHYWGIFLKK